MSSRVTNKALAEQLDAMRAELAQLRADAEKFASGRSTTGTTARGKSAKPAKKPAKKPVLVKRLNNAVLSRMSVGECLTGFDRAQMAQFNRALAGRGSSFAAGDWDAEAKARTYVRRPTQAHPDADGVSFIVSTPNGTVERVA